MISKFISEVRTRGLARTNRYQLDIPFPVTGAYAIDRDAAELTNLFCESVQIPGLNIATTPVRIFGEAREMPYEKSFEPITTTFYVDAGMQVKTAFDRWMAMIVDPQTRTLGYYKDYIRDFDIHIDTVDESRAMSVAVYEAYPKSVSAIQMDAAAKDVMKLTVTWQYKYWISYNYNSAGARTNPRPIYFRGESDPQGINTGNGMPVTFDEPAVTEEEIIAVEDGDGI